MSAVFINFVFLYSARPLNNAAHHSFLLQFIIKTDLKSVPSQMDSKGNSVSVRTVCVHVRTVDESQVLIILIAE
jgi:hypothetical protein